MTIGQARALNYRAAHDRAGELTREIRAPTEQVWAMLSDVTRMGKWSPETEGATWLGGATDSQPGVGFPGMNRNARIWKTVGTLAGSAFA
jgi:uncharacterized protein YndB with AHSA1/START domain